MLQLVVEYVVVVSSVAVVPKVYVCYHFGSICSARELSSFRYVCCVMMAASESESTVAGDAMGTTEEPPSKKARMSMQSIPVWNISVSLPSGSTITLAVTDKSTICSVKNTIASRVGNYPHFLQRLMMNGEELIHNTFTADLV